MVRRCFGFPVRALFVLRRRFKQWICLFLGRVRRFANWLNRYSNLLVLLLTLFVAYLAYLSIAGQGVGVEFSAPAPTETLAGIVTIQGVITGGIFAGVFDDLVVKVDETILWERAGRCRIGDSLDILLDTRQLLDGPHLIRVLFMSNGRTRRISTLPIYIDNTPPLILVSSPEPGEVVSERLVLSAEAIGASAPPEATVDGLVQLESHVLDTRSLAEGEHTLTFEAIDLAGNVYQVERKFVVDRTSPVIVSLGLEKGAHIGGTRLLEPEVTESNISSAIWRVDDEAAFEGLCFPFATAEYGEGRHTITLEIVDAVGQKAAMTREVVIDNTPPDIFWYRYRSKSLSLPSWAVIDLSPIDLSQWRENREGNRVYLPLDVGRDGATVQYYVDGALASSKLSLADFDPHVNVIVEVRVSDVAGNTASATLPIKVDNSLSSVFSWLEYERPGVLLQGQIEASKIPLALAFAFDLRFPFRWGQGAGPYCDEPERFDLGLELPIGLIYVTFPVNSMLGAGMRFRLGNVAGSGVASEDRRFQFDLGCAPIFSPVSHSLPPPSDIEIWVHESESEEKITYWACLGLSTPLFPATRLSPEIPVNAWITLGCGYALRETRVLALTWEGSELSKTELIERNSEGRFYLFLGFEVSLLTSVMF